MNKEHRIMKLDIFFASIQHSLFPLANGFGVRYFFHTLSDGMKELKIE